MTDNFLIGLDLDGVCYHYDRTARYMLRRRIFDRGEVVPEELKVPSTYWNSIQGHVSDEDWDWLWSDGVKAGLFRYGHVVGGSIEGVQELSNLGDVIAITARPKEAVHDTLVWLSTMFDKAPLSGLVIQSFGQRKSEVRPVPHVYIDDAVHNSNDILCNTNATVVLYDDPQNYGYPESRRVIRARGWREVVDIVAKLREEALDANV